MGYVGKCPEFAHEVASFRQTVSAEKRLASKSFEKTIEVYWKHQQVKDRLKSRRSRKTHANDYSNAAAVFCHPRAQDPSSPLHVLPVTQGLQDIDAPPELAMTMIGLNPDVRRLKAFGVGGKPFWLKPFRLKSPWLCSSFQSQPLRIWEPWMTCNQVF